MLDESICHLRGVALFLFLMENSVSKHVYPDPTPHDAASDVGMHCLRKTLLRVSSKNGLCPVKPIQKMFISIL